MDEGTGCWVILGKAKWFQYLFVTNSRFLPHFDLSLRRLYLHLHPSPISFQFCIYPVRKAFFLRGNVVSLFIPVTHHLCKPFWEGPVTQCNSSVVFSLLQAACLDVIRAQHGNSAVSILRALSPHASLPITFLCVWQWNRADKTVPTFVKLTSSRDMLIYIKQHHRALMFWSSPYCCA